VDCNADCTVDLQGGCQAKCSQPEGALFCNGQYVDVVGSLQDCLDYLSTLEVEVNAHAEAEASVSCAAAPGSSSSAPFAGTGLAALVAGVGVAAARRRKRS
jgi:hypothetical protein